MERRRHRATFRGRPKPDSVSSRREQECFPTRLLVAGVTCVPTPRNFHGKVSLKPGADDETKRTNEIGIAIPLLDRLDNIAAKTLTADALLTQRALASSLLERRARHLFTAKNNQPNRLLDIAVQFATEGTRRSDFEEPPTLAHGRIEPRAIWTSTPSTTPSTSPASAKPSCSSGCFRSLPEHRIHRFQGYLGDLSLFRETTDPAIPAKEGSVN